MSISSSTAFRIVLCIVIDSILITACTTTQRDTFPGAEIVYQSSRWMEPSIGFVNSDGSNKTTLELDEIYPNRPIWSSDKDTVLFIEPYHPAGALGDVNSYGGRISVWENGRKIKVCKNRNLRLVSSIETFLPSLESSSVLITTPWRLILFDFGRCKEIETYIDLSNDQDRFFAGASISSDGIHIIYSEIEQARTSPSYTLKILDTRSDEIDIIGEGINPSLSPDEAQIAFTWSDGIYIMDFDGTNIQHLLKYGVNPDSLRVFDFNIPPPAPRWSPDGNWLVYHKCKSFSTGCHDASEYAIFKVNVLSGEEIEVLDGGLFPYWRDN